MERNTSDSVLVTLEASVESRIFISLVTHYDWMFLNCSLNYL